MLVKHEIQSIIQEIGTEDLQGAFEEAVHTCRDAQVIYHLIDSVLQKVLSSEDATDEAEDYTCGTYSNLVKFNTWQSSKNPMVNKYLGRVLGELATYNKNLNTVVDCMFCVAKKELFRLQKQAYNVASGLLFFCIYEFRLLDVVEPDEFGEVMVDEIVQHYCEKSGVASEALAMEFKGSMPEFQVRFDVFDAFPELEDPFLRIMGPNILGVDESALTIELIKDVVTGIMLPEELVSLMVEDREYVCDRTL